MSDKVERMTERITIALTPSEKAEITKRVENNLGGLNISIVVRSLLLYQPLEELEGLMSSYWKDYK